MLSKSTFVRLSAVVYHGNLEIDPLFRGRLYDSSELSISQLISAATTDLGECQGRLEALFAALPAGERPSSLPALGIDPSLEVKAYAKSPRGGPHLFVSVGFLLALDELLLEALSHPDFLDLSDERGRVDDDVAAPFMRVRPHRDRPTPFLDYRWLAAVRSYEPGAIVCSMPTAPFRLLQFELLRDLALQWLWLHETTHWTGGHVATLQELRRGQDDVHASLAEPTCGANHDGIEERSLRSALAKLSPALDLPAKDIRKAIEFDADHNGFMLLIRLQDRVGSRRTAFARYSHRIRQVPTARRFLFLSKFSLACRMRMMTVAAAAVILLFERAARIAGTVGEYPLPLARLLNVQLVALAGSPYVRFDDDALVLETSAVERRSFKPFVREALMRPYQDFNVLAGKLGLDPFFFLGEGRPPEIAPIVSDFFSFFNADVTEDAFKTEAGRQTFEFRAKNDIVARYCERRGVPFRIRL